MSPQHSSHSELSSLLEHFSDPAILLGLDYRVLAANGPYRKVYGNGPAVERRFCYEVSHGYDVPCDQAGETCPLKNTLDHGHSQRVVHLHHTPQGDEHVDVETFPVHNDVGEIVYMVEVLHKTQTAGQGASDSGMVGKSPAFTRMLNLIQRVAKSAASVLLLGESGTGKELIAHAVHAASGRAHTPLVPVECSGLPEMLFESEMFGHEKGSFTGADTAKVGLVEAANGGTLFLDEVGDIPLNLQVKLLRLLETGTYRRVGSLEPRRADFRLICATHRDLKEMVKEGTFRQDLYFRISSFPIHVPNLRERHEDIPLLVNTLLERISDGPPPPVHPETLRILTNHRYIGNIRELRNILEWAGLMADGGTILPTHLPDDVQQQAQDAPDRAPSITFQGDILPLDELEAHYLAWARARHKGDKRSLAKKLGVAERTLYRKLARE